MKPFNPKPRPCAHCGSDFVPVRPMQSVCSPICAARKIKADKAQERARIVTRKEAIKTIPVLLREAQAVFNKWIRTRDDGLPCISCGKYPGDMKALHAGRDAGHYRSIGCASHLRFHPDNCHAQCVHCNQWKAGNAVDYRIGLVARIGPQRVEALERNNASHKWTADELRAIKATYQRKLKALKTNQPKQSSADTPPVSRAL